MNSIFITGGAQGIGLSTATLFHQKNWRVACFDLDATHLAHLKESLPNVHCYEGSVTDPEAIREALEDFTQDSGGALDVLHNNAGIIEVGEFEDVPLQKQRSIVEVNLIGTITVTYTALPFLKKSEHAVIVNMSSASAMYGNPELSAYAATKSAIKSLTEGWSIAFRKYGIRVTDLLPIHVKTRMVSDYEHLYRKLDAQKIELTPELIAQKVWSAVHGKKLHYLVGRDTKVFTFLLWILPERWAPPVVRKVLGYKD